MYRLAIVASHPIQYQAHWFRALAGDPDIDLTVFFCHAPTAKEQGQVGFGTPFSWDVPLLDGYPSRFLRNVARKPSVATFFGLNTPEIGAEIRRGKWHAVLVLGWNHLSYWQAIRACWATSTPVIVRGDSHLHGDRSPVTLFLKRMVHGRFVPRFDACLAVGTWSEEYYRYYGARRVFRVPHSIARDRFDRSTDSASGISPRSALGLDDDATVFLFVGKMIEKKRPMDFVRAIEIAARSARVQGLMVGNGPLREPVETFVHERRIPVHLAGFVNQSEISRVYCAADVLVLPSDGRETWGVVVDEAMALGLPCLVSDQVGSGPDLIVPGKTGDIFSLGSVEDLARLMVRYDAMREKLPAMGACARQHAQQYADTNAVAGVVEALRYVTAGSRGGDSGN